MAGKYSEDVWQKTLNTILNPAVFAALVTTVVGSLAVAIATNTVTQRLGERELQFKSVESLVDFIVDADIRSEDDVRKLGALTTLLQDQEELGVRLDGFRRIVEGFHTDEIAQLAAERDDAQTEAGRMEDERRALQAQLDDTSSSSTQERRRLEDSLKTIENSLRDTELRRADVDRRLTSAREEHAAAQRALGAATDEAARLRDRLASTEQDLRAARAQLGDLRNTGVSGQVHRVEVELRTAADGLGGPTDDALTVVFSNASGATPEAVDGTADMEEFSVTGRSRTAPGTTTTLVREVRDLRFLGARYVRVLNWGGDGWAGEWMTVRIDGQPVMSQQPLYPREGSQARGGIQYFGQANGNYWEGRLPPTAGSLMTR